MSYSHPSTASKIKAGFCVIAVSTLSACGPSVPEATDQQLLNILGTENRVGDTTHLTLPKRLVECVRGISGLDDALYVDMPADVLGMFKTDCRVSLSTLLSSDANKELGFKQTHFENRDLAERLTVLMVTADENLTTAREMQRQLQFEQEEQRKADELAAVQTEIDAERDAYQQFIASIDSRISDAEPLCLEHERLTQEIKAKARNSQWAYRNTFWICLPQRMDEIKAEAAKHLVTLSEATPERYSLFGFRAPYYGNASHDWFVGHADALSNEVATMRSVLEGLR